MGWVSPAASTALITVAWDTPGAGTYHEVAALEVDAEVEAPDAERDQPGDDDDPGEEEPPPAPADEVEPGLAPVEPEQDAEREPARRTGGPSRRLRPPRRTPRGPRPRAGLVELGGLFELVALELLFVELLVVELLVGLAVGPVHEPPGDLDVAQARRRAAPGGSRLAPCTDGQALVDADAAGLGEPLTAARAGRRAAG